MAATATVDFRTDSDKLREQAKALQTKADKLSEQRMELLREVWALEADADRIDREAERERTRPRLAVAKAGNPETDTALLERVAEFLESVEEASSTEVADHLAITQTRARTALARLEAIGMVRRSGLKRGTRYRLFDEYTDAPEPTHTENNVRAFGNYETVVRDAAIKLGVFEFVSLQRELPEISEGTLRRWLRTFEDAGMLEAEQIDGSKVYAYTKPEGSTPARPKIAPPENAVRVRERRSGSVAGTGGRAGVGSPIVDALIREVRPYGVTFTTSKHRVEFRIDGVIVATSSKTPGASSLKGTRGQLRAAGVPV